MVGAREELIAVVVAAAEEAAVRVERTRARSWRMDGIAARGAGVDGRDSVQSFLSCCEVARRILQLPTHGCVDDTRRVRVHSDLMFRELQRWMQRQRGVLRLHKTSTLARSHRRIASRP